jgi:hypothetical protein
LCSFSVLLKFIVAGAVIDQNRPVLNSTVALKPLAPAADLKSVALRRLALTYAAPAAELIREAPAG